MRIFDEESKQKILPNVVCEPSIGVERSFLVFLFDSYFYDKERENIVLKLNPKLAPVKAAVFPIIKKEEFEKMARIIFDDLSKEWKVSYDESGSIGRRYARNDEIGTPYCITVDFQTLEDNTVTIRDRDTMKQERVAIQDIRKLLENKLT